MPPPSAAPLARKLQIKPGQHVLVLNAPDGYLDELKPLPDAVKLAHRSEGKHDVVQLFVASAAEFDRRAPGAVKAVRPGGILWICWPKGSARAKSDINRDTMNAAAKRLGWTAVASISIDETWSALRFKPA